MRLERSDGIRRIPALNFFRGLYETALEPGEIRTAVELPAREPDEIHLFDEYARRPGDFAIAGLAMSVRFERACIAKLNFGFLGVGSTPLSAPRLAQACIGLSAAEAGLLAKQTLAEEIEPSGDHHASADYRVHLAQVLMTRLLTRAAQQTEQAS
jgi:carbon-monoxide dehydrogenase medium subunit